MMRSRFRSYSFMLIAGGAMVAYGLYRSKWAVADPAGDRVPQQAQAGVEFIPGQTFRDELSVGGRGPEMVVIPAGAYWMGSEVADDTRDSEWPRHKVTISQPLAVAKYETTVEEFRRFARAASHEMALGCWQHGPDEVWVLKEEAAWFAPGYEQAENFPVTCVNWEDAKAYADWMSEQTGKHYRLPSEAEFEYFNRAGRQGDYPAPVRQKAELCSWMNGADQASGMPYANDCHDGFSHASPVGHFPPNTLGLFDTAGNLWEFTADCWNDDYAGSWRTWFRGPPVDGSPWSAWYCVQHVIRGGSYLSSPDNLRLPRREAGSGPRRLNRVGIRLLRDK